MILSLVLPWLFGVVVADRLLQLREALAKLSVGWAVGWLVALMGTNFGLLGGLGLGRAIAVCFGIQAVLALGIGWRGRPAGWDWKCWGRGTWAFLVVGMALVHFTTNTILFLNPDDDFFLHAPLQGHMLQGLFPPRNPFFSELVYAGHYARDLLTVMVAYLSGASLYGVQTPVTVGLQLAAFLVLFSTLWRQTRDVCPTILGTVFVFIGANAGFRGGWLDTVANNNALAQMLMALVFFLTLEALFGRPRWPATFWAGLSLGGLAWAYETSFAGVCLGLCGLAFSTLALRSLRVSQLVTAGVIVLLTLLLGVSQGGVFRHLADKLLGGQKAPQTQVDTTLRIQSQEVSIKFPKERLFHIKLDRSGEEMSMAYSILPLLRALPKPSGTPGYVSVFSPYVLRIHWIGLYLAPLSLVMLARRRCWVGLLLWWVGFSAYFLPSVVDFGFWESEVFRWEYVASWGFSGALGVALGQWWSASGGPLLSLSGGSVSVHRRAFQAALLGLLVLLNVGPSLQQIVVRSSQLENLRMGVLFPGTLDWLRRQPELAFSAADARLALWMAPQVKAGDRVLSTARDENLYNVYPEATFSGLSGALPIGHAFPSAFEGLGTLPFRQKAAARAFWFSHDPALLANLEPDWLVLRPPLPDSLEKVAGLELVRTEEDRRLYRVKAPELPPETPVPGLELERVAFELESLDVETACTVKLTLRNAGDQVWQGTTRLVYEFVDLESGQPVELWDRFSQPLTFGVGPGQSTTVSTVLITPHSKGRYSLVTRIGGVEMAESPEISVGNREVVAGLRISSVHAVDPVTPGQVTRFRLRLRNSSSVALKTTRPLLAAIVPKSDVSLHLVRDFQEVALNIPAGGEAEITLPAVIPENPNGFQLMLIPRDGWIIMDLPALSSPE